MLVLKAFGTLDVRSDGGAPLTSLLTQSKRAALFTYLVLSRPGEMHRRDALLALFWPELDQTHGRNALSQSLSFLRRELGNGVLVTRGGDEVGVDAASITSDVRAFEEAVAAEDWAGAVETYGGDLLAGLHVVGAAPFTDWVDRERERLREAASGAAWKLAHVKIAAGELTEAERVAQRALVLVPTDESRVRGFIEALAGAGDRAAALRFYERFRAVLAEELEVEPAPETVAVVEAVRERTEAVEVASRTPGPDTADFPQPEAPASVVDALPAGPVGVDAATPVPRPADTYARWVVGIAVLTTFLLGGYSLVRDGRSGTPATLIGEGLAAKYDQVLVADFAASDTGVGMAATEWLRTELDQSDVVRPVSPAAVGDALRRMDRDPSLPVDATTAREIAIRDAYPMIVVGELEAVGEGYLLTARLEAGGSGEVLGRFHEAASRGAELVAALDRLGGDIRARIGESKRAIRRSPPLERVSTPSIDALRLYTEALRLRAREGRRWDAVDLFEGAVEADTGFAMAYLELGQTLNQLMTRWEYQRELSQKAWEHRERLTDYQRLGAEGSHLFQRLVSPDKTMPPPDECDVYGPMVLLDEAYVRRHPDEPRIWPGYSYNLERVGRYEDAASTRRRALEVDSSSARAWQSFYKSQLTVGGERDAARTLEAWRRRLGESPRWLGSFLSAAARRREYSVMDSVLDAVQVRFGVDVSLNWGESLDLSRANVDLVRGRTDEGWRHFDEGLRRVTQHGNRGIPVALTADRALVRLGSLRDELGVTEELTAMLSRLPDSVDLAGAWINVGLAYALAGEPDLARRALDSLEAHGRGNWSLVRGNLRGAIALAEDRPAETIRLLRESNTECSFNFEADLRVDRRWRRILAGRAYEAMNEPGSAVVEYEMYFSEPTATYPLPLDAIFLFDTLERLGRLHEQLGHDAEAASYYERAAELWKDADPQLQPRVQRLRERAAELRASTIQE